MKRIIEYKVLGKGKVSPSTRQWGGMQYEDNATEIVFDIASVDTEGIGKIIWRIDLFSHGAVYNTGEASDVENNKVSRALPYDITQYGGDIKITLVGTEVDEYDNEVRVVYTIPVEVYLTAVEGQGEHLWKEALRISAAEASAKEAAEKAIEAQSAADAAKMAAQEAQSKTEQARYQLDGNITFVFQGGDAESSSKVDINVQNIINEAVQAAHPVGSLYWSSEEKDPGSLFGGTWERVKDKFILAAGEKFSAGQTGGEIEHKLEIKEMPVHWHNVAAVLPGETEARNLQMWATNVGPGNGWHVASHSNEYINDEEYVPSHVYATSNGGDSAHNNMPPYEVYYCWKRIA